MTIASEITRLQNDKAAICTAIENKWVTVWNVTLDDYASCIDAIEQGGGWWISVEALIVGWGGAGCSCWWGWWAGWVIHNKSMSIWKATGVVVWAAWCNSSLWNEVAYWGGKWNFWVWCNWWSWWWWGHCYCKWWCWTIFQWTSWWGWGFYSWWGWGWIASSWCPWDWSCYWWNWWIWYVSDISWTEECYAWWWGWWWWKAGWSWSYWGWDWGGCKAWCPATTCWSWWWGGRPSCAWWAWACWVVIVRYPTSCWYDLTWWCKYCCWDYTIHCFTSNWVLYQWQFQAYPWIWHNPTSCLISMSSDWTNWLTMSDRNLWATNNNVSSTCSYWCKYQWGNNFWFNGASSSCVSCKTTTQPDTTWYWPWNYYCRNCYVYSTSARCDWSKYTNDNLWGCETWTYAAMQWPTASWFHIPSQADFECMISLYCSIKWAALTAEDAQTYFCIPYAWYRSSGSSWCWCCYWDCFTLWSSTWWTNSSWCVVARSYGSTNPTWLDCCSRAYWRPIRPFKNEWAIPDENWIPLLLK